jgi:hypothetical protein
VSVLPAHLVARWLLLEDVLDHTPAPARLSSLRLDDDGVPYVSDHATEPSVFDGGMVPREQGAAALTEADPRSTAISIPRAMSLSRLRQLAACKRAASSRRPHGAVRFRLTAVTTLRSCVHPALLRNATATMTPTRAAHNPEVAGSNPAPATEKALETGPFLYPGGRAPSVSASAAAGLLRPSSTWRNLNLRARLRGGRTRRADAREMAAALAGLLR